MQEKHIALDIRLPALGDRRWLATLAAHGAIALLALAAATLLGQSARADADPAAKPETKPAGELSDPIEDIGLRPDPSVEPVACNEWCCIGDHASNLVFNGDFEMGMIVPVSSNPPYFGFYSDYSSASPFGPGKYYVTNSAGAPGFFSNAVAMDHCLCKCGYNPNPAGPKDSFMVVDGKTNRPTATPPQAVWWKDVNVAPSQRYHFCAFLKNFPAAAQDVKPRITIQFRSDGITSLGRIGPATVNTPPYGACDWQVFSRDVTTLAGTSFLRIQILLDETGVGQGNDLAIDDISLQAHPVANLGVSFSTSGSQGNIYYGVTATPPALPANYSSSWAISRVNCANPSQIINTVTNPAWSGQNPCKFEHYAPLGVLSQYATVGVFNKEQCYRITYCVTSCCAAQACQSWLLKYNAASGHVVVSPYYEPPDYKNPK